MSLRGGCGSRGNYLDATDVHDFFFLPLLLMALLWILVNLVPENAVLGRHICTTVSVCPPSYCKIDLRKDLWLRISLILKQNKAKLENPANL